MPAITVKTTQFFRVYEVEENIPAGSTILIGDQSEVRVLPPSRIRTNDREPEIAQTPNKSAPEPKPEPEPAPLPPLPGTAIGDKLVAARATPEQMAKLERDERMGVARMAMSPGAEFTRDRTQPLAEWPKILWKGNRPRNGVVSPGTKKFLEDRQGWVWAAQRDQRFVAANSIKAAVYSLVPDDIGMSSEEINARTVTLNLPLMDGLSLQQVSQSLSSLFRHGVVRRRKMNHKEADKRGLPKREFLYSRVPS